MNQAVFAKCDAAELRELCAHFNIDIPKVRLAAIARLPAACTPIACTIIAYTSTITPQEDDKLIQSLVTYRNQQRNSRTSASRKLPTAAAAEATAAAGAEEFAGSSSGGQQVRGNSRAAHSEAKRETPQPAKQQPAKKQAKQQARKQQPTAAQEAAAQEAAAHEAAEQAEDADLMREIYSAMEARVRRSEPSRPRWANADAMRKSSDLC